MEYNVFDIETGALPINQLIDKIPEFKAPKNYKDEEKIQANIEQQQAEWIEKAALNAVTGQVLAIGVKRDDGEFFILHQNEDDERTMLQWFWDQVTSLRGFRWVGFNSNGFDLPFMFRRSIMLGVTPSLPWRATRYWDNRFIDLLEVWGCGNREFIGLDTVAKFLDVGGKTGNGAHFAETYKNDPKSALDYLKHDLNLTESVLIKMLPWIDGGDA